MSVPKKTVKKWLKKIIAIIVLVIFVCIYVLYRSRYAIHITPINSPYTVPVTTYVVKSTPLTEITQTNGQVKATNQVMIHPKVDGYITKILVHEGDTVKQGQPLIILDHAADKDDLAQKKAAMDLAQSNYQRALHIQLSGAISKQQLATLKSTYVSDQAAYQQSADTLKDKTITAPIDGVVGALNLTLGDYITPNSTLFNITDLNHLQVTYNLSSKYFNNTHLKQNINIISLTNKNQVATGYISFISSTFHHLTQTFNIHAQFLNNKHYFNPGESVMVEQVIAYNPSGIRVPLEAVMTSLSGNSVYVIEHDHAIKRSVKIGLSSQNSIHILKGLKPGDRVITSTSQVRDGSKVSWQ